MTQAVSPPDTSTADGATTIHVGPPGSKGSHSVIASKSDAHIICEEYSSCNTSPGWKTNFRNTMGLGGSTWLSERWQSLNARRRVLGMPLGWALVAATAAAVVLGVALGVGIPLGLRAKSGGEAAVAAAPEAFVVGPRDFVRVGKDMQFEEGGCPFYVVGFSAWDLIEMVLTKPDELASRMQQKAGDAPVGPPSAVDLGPNATLQDLPNLNQTLARDLSLGLSHAEVGLRLAGAAALGLNTVRTWAHTSNDYRPFQIQAGVYSEEGFKALDFVLQRAAELGLRVILSLVDNWHYYNGVDQFVDWSPTAPIRMYARPSDQAGDPALDRLQGGLPHPVGVSNAAPGASLVNSSKTNATAMDGTNATTTLDPVQSAMYEKTRHSLFWSDPGSRKIYRDHVHAITQRRNTFNGRLYAEDPTILAWDLVNEPRCESDPLCHQSLQMWIQEMSLYLKSLAPLQLVTIGSEGFFGPSTPELQQYNPGEWAVQVGQDFLNNNLPDTIDFATLHMWPDNWALLESPAAAAAPAPGPDGNSSAASVAATDGNATEGGATSAGLRNRTALIEQNFLRSWVQSHLTLAPPGEPRTAAAAGFRKPVLLEEFGKKLPTDQVGNPTYISSVRDPIFIETYELVNAWTNPAATTTSADTSATTAATASEPAVPLLGSLFWQWNGSPATYPQDYPDQYGVSRKDSTVSVIASHATAMEQRAHTLGQADPKCTAV